MKKWIALAACAAALALTRPARAQEEPTSARLAAAEAMMNSVDMQHPYERTIEAMIKSQLQMNPATAQYEDVMRKFFNQYLSWQAVRPDMVRVYALTYTEDELRQLTAFYQTSLGRRILETMPDLSRRSTELTQRRVMEHMPELMQQIMQQVQPGSSSGTPPKP
jgi:hypothetical protein